MEDLKARGFKVALPGPTTGLVQWEGADTIKIDGWNFVRDSDNPRLFNYDDAYVLRNEDELMSELSSLYPGVFRLEACDEEGYRWVVYAKEGEVKTEEAKITFEADPWGAYPNGVGPLIY